MSTTTNQPRAIGLFGFGVVGEALYQVLHRTPALQAHIKKVCIRDPQKVRNAPAALFTTNRDELLQDPEISIIIELIDDATAAFEIVSTALKNKKAVVSANKKMIATQLNTLLELQRNYGTPFLYEAAACASIPVIRNLEEYYDNDLLQSISGIVNGSTNYILTRIFEDKTDFETALHQAQVAGFAESDPTLDISGQDAANKLSILLTHAYGIIQPPHRIITQGIQALRPEDAVYAQEKGQTIRLVAQAQKLKNGKVAALVLPQFVSPGSQLYHVKDEFNGMVIESSLADRQFFYGKGAGGFPTASAVLSDLSALRYQYRYEYKKLRLQTPATLSSDFYLHVYVSFDPLYQAPEIPFSHILSYSSTEQRTQVTGVLHCSQLSQSDWWKAEGISLILLEDGIVETLSLADERSRKRPHLERILPLCTAV